jgi:hypothetical protein
VPDPRIADPELTGSATALAAHDAENHVNMNTNTKIFTFILRLFSAQAAPVVFNKMQDSGPRQRPQ